MAETHGRAEDLRTQRYPQAVETYCECGTEERKNEKLKHVSCLGVNTTTVKYIAQLQ